MVSNINFEKKEQQIIVRVKKSSLLISTNYNLYLPTQTQVIPVQPNAQIDIVKKLITFDGERILHGVKIESHSRRLVKDQNCGLEENKEIQFKNLKAAPSKCVTLADRMKSNKLPSYISAFANHHGGHIYYGIRDDGTVEGEVVTDKDRDEITKKVGKTIGKMIWPQKPEKGKHWDIFFEPVLDNSFQSYPVDLCDRGFRRFLPRRSLRRGTRELQNCAWKGRENESFWLENGALSSRNKSYFIW